MKNGIFVTATGTDIGKTYISALLVKTLRRQGIDAGYFKPALSGAVWSEDRLVPGDADYVCRKSGLSGPPDQYVAYVYKPSVSPHLAAKMSGRPIEKDVVSQSFLEIQKRFDYVVAEGCGGIVCPLRADDDEMMMLTDVATLTGFQLLIVAPSGLGAIQAAVTTAEYAAMKGFEICGIVMNHFKRGDLIHEDNRYQIERLTGIKVTGVADDAEEIDVSCFL